VLCEVTVERSDKSDPLTLALLNPMEMADADRRTVASAGPELDLMDAAGRAVAKAVEARWPLQPVLVLCGPGNNGGDGFAAARHLAATGRPVRIALLGDRERLSSDADRHARLWPGTVEPFLPTVLEGAGVVIDAIFGSGLSRPIDGPARLMIEALQTRGPALCAVDVPSGLDGATGQVRGAAAVADLTVTFFRKKPCHLLLPGRTVCGDLLVADIGVPTSVLRAIDPHTFENGPALWLDRFPGPQIDGHKYRRGNVLVLGGATTTGAARMTARGAMRAGAGLVTLAAPTSAWAVYAGALEGTIVHAIGGVADFEALLADNRRNAIAIGPGAGVDEATRRAVLAALATRRRVVLDADALTAFASEPTALFAAISGPCVLTPHEGEFSRLFGAFDLQGDKLRRARDAAALSGAVVLLKGADTVIAAPDGRAIINANAPPQLATGGSGDVLTGFVVGLLAQGLDAFDAASAAAWLHGEAGVVAGLGLVAGDLPEALPTVLQRLRTMGS
jgi:hydroxyethylthiazole kinase-like uncharacterized protein yjeF